MSSAQYPRSSITWVTYTAQPSANTPETNTRRASDEPWFAYAPWR